MSFLSKASIIASFDPNEIAVVFLVHSKTFLSTCKKRKNSISKSTHNLYAHKHIVCVPDYFRLIYKKMPLIIEN